MAERVVFQTQDQVAVVGTFVSSVQPRGAVLLLHMMPADRTSWAALQEALTDRGLASLAVDLRGHGESLIQDGRRIDYRDFDDEGHQGYLEDVRAALHWLASRGFSNNHVALVGASIGANAALLVAKEQKEIPAVALLSPGEDYRGLRTFDAAAGLYASQALWSAASQGDDQESFDAAKEIVGRAPGAKKTFVPFTSSGHGTNLFVTHPDLVALLAEWLAKHVTHNT